MEGGKGEIYCRGTKELGEVNIIPNFTLGISCVCTQTIYIMQTPVLALMYVFLVFPIYRISCRRRSYDMYNRPKFPLSNHQFRYLLLFNPASLPLAYPLYRTLYNPIKHLCDVKAADTKDQQPGSNAPEPRQVAFCLLPWHPNVHAPEPGDDVHWQNNGA